MTSYSNRFRSLVLDNSGESLVETLVALLVSTFSLIMLAVAIRTSAIIVSRTKAMADQYYSTTSTLATDRSATGSVEVGVALSGAASGISENVSVTSWTGTTSASSSLVLPGKTPVATYTVTFS